MIGSLIAPVLPYLPGICIHQSSATHLVVVIQEDLLVKIRARHSSTSLYISDDVKPVRILCIRVNLEIETPLESNLSGLII